MVVRILWGFVLLATAYVVSVFVLPEQSDRLADTLGVTEFNRVLRELKEGSSADVQLPKSFQDLNQGSGIVQDARRIIGQTQSGIAETKTVIETKMEQAKRVGESVEKTAKAISDLKANVSELTNFATGSSSATGSTASGATSTGSAASGSTQTPKKNAPSSAKSATNP